MNKLRLGPIPRPDVVRVTVAIPAPLKENLDRYAELYAATYGEQADAVALIPHMLAAFIAGDRGFRRARTGLKPQPSEAPILRATSTETGDPSERETP